jgi:hypothetical protein
VRALVRKEPYRSHQPYRRPAHSFRPFEQFPEFRTFHLHLRCARHHDRLWAFSTCMLWFSSAAAASLDTMVAFSWDHHKCNCASVGAGHLSKAYAAGCSDHSAQWSWTPTLSFQFAPFRNTDKSAAEGPMQVRHYSWCTLGLHYSLSLHTVPRHAKLGAIATGLEYCAFGMQSRQPH